MTNVAGLECAACGKTREAGRVHNLCECGGPLLVRYHLDAIRKQWNRDSLAGAPDSMWRYAPVLPASETSIVSLGEGMTPLVHASRLGSKLGANQLLIKDEGVNPTGSFKARGLSCAISLCKQLGIRKTAIPSAGNAAGALACTVYGAQPSLPKRAAVLSLLAE